MTVVDSAGLCGLSGSNFGTMIGSILTVVLSSGPVLKDDSFSTRPIVIVIAVT